ncbi:hypothetical protein O3G_MSEX010030 [Manduca sexta]|uniref:Odorant receptor n=1 Tax=Manduca sexta TaxID=7130 RepID=A0A5K8B1Q4_MANSE|nr:hypothetical protein O3G_MSEX010030 [Manduca sexta]CUQ99307.1 TPA: Olfactory receptor 74 [Manduca sexta]
MNLKQSHPQKYYMKLVFRCLYYFGLGDGWYEQTNRSANAKKLYLIWAVIANLYVVGIICNECLANFRSDLSDLEKNDLVQFTFAHLSILAKIMSFYFQKSKIRIIFEKLLEETRSVFYSEELDKQCVKQYIRYSLALIGVSYLTLFTTTINGIRVHFMEGIPIRTEVTFYPRASDSGYLINILRFFIEFHWWYIVGIMVVIDCLGVASLVFVSYKFKLLQLYFKQMREKVLENHGKVERKVLEDEFKKDFVVGVKLHAHALWCARNVQQGLGSIYSVLVFESVSLMVMCLVKLVASLLSTAIFHCGWEFIRADTKLRVLTVFAIQQSQVPVYMMAFGIMTLSYNNFISKSQRCVSLGFEPADIRPGMAVRSTSNQAIAAK